MSDDSDGKLSNYESDDTKKGLLTSSDEDITNKKGLQKAKAMGRKCIRNVLKVSLSLRLVMNL